MTGCRVGGGRRRARRQPSRTPRPRVSARCDGRIRIGTADCESALLTTAVECIHKRESALTDPRSGTCHSSPVVPGPATQRWRRSPSVAGVSRATVSRVVNDSPRVSPDVRLSVQAAIEQLGYTPNRAARSLVTKRSDSVAVVITQPTGQVFTDPFFPRLLRGISSALAASDRQLVLLMPESPADERRAVRVPDRGPRRRRPPRQPARERPAPGPARGSRRADRDGGPASARFARPASLTPTIGRAPRRPSRTSSPPAGGSSRRSRVPWTPPRASTA